MFVLCLIVGFTAAMGQSGSKLYGPTGVSPQAVRQGVLGSCYFHASIASLAQIEPSSLRDAIVPSPDGGYRVHFFDGPDEVVYPTDIEYGREHGFDRSDGDWVLVLMRAYAQRTVRMSMVSSVQRSDWIPTLVKPAVLSWLDQSGMLLLAYDRAIRGLVRQDGMIDKNRLRQNLDAQLKTVGVPQMEAGMLEGFLDEQGFFDSLAQTIEQNGEVFGLYKGVGQGGIPERVIRAFLGGARTGQLATDRQVFERLQALHSGKSVIVANTWPVVPAASAQFSTASWWVANHAYSVLDYDPASQTVRLRNPWGERPKPDGTFTLPLADFLAAYENYFYSGSDVRAGN